MALIEQHQQRPNQQQQHNSQNFVQINRDQPAVVQLPDASHASLQAEGKVRQISSIYHIKNKEAFLQYLIMKTLLNARDDETAQ
ncbi:hypothetical protein ACTXT7_000244 [Hymenolepis weldensis]